MAHNYYERCEICPKLCKVNRQAGRVGICGESADLRISWAGLHFGEEPVITGSGGSGAIFITGCNLGCPFCQNFQITREGLGKVVRKQEFVDICLKLQLAGAENINIVTGSHAIPILVEYLRQAQLSGLTIPIVWNSSSYESTEMLELLNGIVTVWLPDLKTLNTEIAQEVLRSKDYPLVATNAILKMVEMSPLEFSENKNGDTMMTSGVILRHLALPGRLDDSKSVMMWFSAHLKQKALLSVMTQYTPVRKHKASLSIKQFENRLLTPSDDEQLKRLLVDFDIDDGFYQLLEPDYSWLPDFSKVQTFSSNLSKPIWHWTCGFTKK